MYSFYNNKVCVHVWDIRSEKWVYIPLTKWTRMSEKEQRQYSDKQVFNTDSSKEESQSEKYYYRLPKSPIYTLYQDMLQQTHLLIAGTTGSGKSVIANGIIATALHYSPANYNLILIDPKRVELSEYREAPHTIAYASEPSEMLRTLQATVQLIDDRFQYMQQQRQKIYEGSKVLVIIDEMADLLTTQKRQVKPLLQRITQIGRASRVMLIGCTQRPTNDIIGNDITVNMDSRVGLRTRNSQESRNIIGSAGCESLPRYGECYYMTPEQFTHYQNVPMISDSERQQLLEHWRTAKKHFSGFRI